MKFAPYSALTKATILLSALSASSIVFLGPSTEQATAQSLFTDSTFSNHDTAQINDQEKNEAVYTITTQQQVTPKSGRRRGGGGPCR